MSSEQGAAFELRPDGRQVDGAERYGSEAEAEQAATAMLIRSPGLQFVEIAEYAAGGGERSEPATVGRIAATQPPAPEEAQIDDLHKLTRGDPEC
jgi:hypothetical protein